MEQSKIVQLVEDIRNASGTEEELDEMLDTFLESVPDPNAADYIYDVQYDHLTSEEIVEKALSYRPIQL